MALRTVDNVKDSVVIAHQNRAGDAYLGILPSWGMGLTRLPRYVGRNKALDILLIGDIVGK